MTVERTTVYEAIGGAPTLRKLVNTFYNLVANDATIRPLFPDDFTEIREKQYMFLTQFFGGPMLYSEHYGSPMMRMRHQRFPIAERHAQAWLKCMSQALDETGITGPVREFMFDRLTLTAHHMVNTEEESDPESDRR